MSDASPQPLTGLAESLEIPGPDAGIRCLALALGAVATSRFEAAEAAFEEALRRQAPAETCLEIAVSAHLLAGFPRAINGLEAFHRALSRVAEQKPRHAVGERERRSREAALTGQAWLQRGQKLFERIYGPNASEVQRQLAGLAPGYDAWVLEHAYGRVLSRDGAPPLVRELAIAGALVLLDVPRQLQSHVRGARRLGARDSDLAGLIATMEILARPDQIEQARQVLRIEGIDPHV